VADDLIASLQIEEEVGPNRFRFPGPPEGRGVVFGGHLLAQMCVAGARADPSKLIRSAHGIFARSVRADEPYELRVDVLHPGRVLASATVSVWQDGSERSRGLVMLTSVEPDLIRHQAAAPVVSRPEDTPEVEDPFGRHIRIVDGLDRGDPDVVAPPRLSVWLRFDDPPGDPVVGQALLAHGTAGFLMGTTMLPHPGVGERLAHRDFSTGIIAHTISFHDDVDPQRWMLITQESTHTGRGRAYGVGQVFTEEGTMVASFNQEAIMRPFPEGHSPEGRESTVL
jgi:acyl-CoA thioesterase-2